ncbi:MAG: hypothetical protein ACRDHF_17055, partial [Tepidiformaceae bacterium]
FRERVESLRDAWSERREVRPLAAAKDFDSQCRLLAILHGWAAGAAADIAAIYGEDLPVRIDDGPSGDPPGFGMFFDREMTLRFAVTESRRGAIGAWTISALWATAPGPGVPVEPRRRNGQWSRARLEEVLLSALGQFERSRSTESAEPRLRLSRIARRPGV